LRHLDFRRFSGTVIVTRKSDGTPVKDAAITVYVYESVVSSGNTDEDGIFDIPDVANCILGIDFKIKVIAKELDLVNIMRIERAVKNGQSIYIQLGTRPIPKPVLE
jgi:hypothetical protein